jgi:putative Mg2+ transporter-C (MgtC) family protein
MDSFLLNVVGHILVAMIAGGLIGLERSYNGHAAGFRTHTLVCMASSLLMLVTVYQSRWFPGAISDTVKIDPTRMAQGIMTGIGFLGAGVIMKEGLSIRGLTTAASIWITSAIGILAGIGFYSTVLIATILTIGTLSVFRWIETKIPSLIYARTSLRFLRESTIPEMDLRTLFIQHGFHVVNMSTALTDEGKFLQYDLFVRTRNEENMLRLSQTLSKLDSIKGFGISLTGD